MIRVVLPAPLRALAGLERELEVPAEGLLSPATVIGAIEQRYPALRGTIVDPATGQRRPFIRFYAGGEDLSFDPIETPLPPSVTSGAEPLIVLGAIAGG